MSGFDKLANALQAQVVNYLDTLSHEDVARLGIYFGHDVYEGKEPNDIQKEFLNKFIGVKAFTKFIEEYVTAQPMFVSSKPTRELIIELTSYITFYATRKLLISDLQHQLQQSNERLLKAKFQGIFGDVILDKGSDVLLGLKEHKAVDVLDELLNKLNELGYLDNPITYTSKDIVKLLK